MNLEELRSALVRRHPMTMNEIEARDVVFRQNFSQEKRREKAPWSMMVPAELEQDEYELWRALGAGDITENEMLSRMTALMELYYSSTP